MALEDLLGPDVFWQALVRTNPEGSDPKSQGDDHIRGVKNVALNTNPRVNAAANWSSAESNQIIGTLNALIAQQDADVGTVVGEPTFRGILPAPRLECNGASYLQADYPLLYNEIGDNYTPVPDATNFNVPDYRGYFLRARDSGAGIDPDAATRSPGKGGTGGDVPGSIQQDIFKAHNHTANAQVFPANGQPAGGIPSVAGVTGTTGGSETRGVNVSIRWSIKADWSAFLGVTQIAPEDDPV